MKKCEHKNLYENYFDSWMCSTPYCVATEYHCKDCGRFIVECDCHYCDGESGWSEKRHRRQMIKKLKEINS